MTLFSRYYPTTSDLFNSIMNEFAPIKGDYYFYRNLRSSLGKTTKITPVNDNLVKLELELAGYGRENIEVYTEDNKLVVSAKDKINPESKSFYKFWSIAENEKVGKVSYVDGVLSIEIEKVNPEPSKRVQYKIE